MFQLIIKSFKIKQKIVVILIVLFILLTSIIYFVSLATDDGTNIDEKKDFIKWVDFNVTTSAMELTYKLDVESHQSDKGVTYNWIELLAYLACKNGGNFKNFKQSDLTNLLLCLENGQKMEDLTRDLKYYSYYYESYQAVLGGFVGNYSIETTDSDGNKSFEQKYGLKVFLPIAKNYS